jgi:hypothetical protein
VGAGLLVSPAQAEERTALLKAAGAPVFLQVRPGDALRPEAAAAAAAIGIAAAGEGGAPAVRAPDALPGLIEAFRAVTEYRAPVFLVAGPGRVPAGRALEAAVRAGVRALCVSDGAGSPFPFAALVGQAAPARGADPALPSFVASEDVSDGHALACALAVGGGLAASAFPVRVALAEEAATDADWKGIGDRLALALRVLWEDAQRASRRVGVPDPRDLTFGHLRALTYDAAALSGARLAGYEERLPWWAH